MTMKIIEKSNVVNYMKWPLVAMFHDNDHEIFVLFSVATIIKYNFIFREP